MCLLVGIEIDLNTIDGGVVLGAVRLGDVVEDVSRGLPAVRVHKAGDHHRKFKQVMYRRQVQYVQTHNVVSFIKMVSS